MYMTLARRPIYAATRSETVQAPAKPDPSWPHGCCLNRLHGAAYQTTVRIRAEQALKFCQGHPIKWSSNGGFCRGQLPAKQYKVLAQRAKCWGTPGRAFGHDGTRDLSPWVSLGLSSPGENPCNGSIACSRPLQGSCLRPFSCQ